MKLISVIVFYSDKAEELSTELDKSLLHPKSEKKTKLSSRIQQLKNELANFPFGKETVGKKYKPAKDRVLVSPAIKLKSECCEKYLKGKRCGRCPCFDLPHGPDSRLN